MSPLPDGASWGDAALELFGAEGEVAVSAAAGAGKTTALVELLLRRIAGAGPGEPLPPREAVAITFTERAGAELVDRLGHELVHGARVRAEAGDVPGARRLEEALRDLPSMAVGTIHAWAASLLRQHAIEAGVDPDFAVLDEEGAAELLSAASLGAAVATLDAGGEDVRRLSAALGGARGIAEAATALVRERATRGLAGAPAGVPGDPAAVAAVRREVLEAARALAAMTGLPTTATGREALARLARALEDADVAGLALGDDDRRLAELSGCLRGWRAGQRDPPELLSARDRLREACGGLPLLAAELAAAPLAASLAEVVGEAGRRFAAAKERAGALDFDDLLVRARDLLRSAPAVAAEVRSRVRALLVDEYQDVNGLQAELLDLVAPPFRVAVGDAKQSIYRFRGADVAVFARLIGRLGGGPGRVVHLRENHRSVPGVIRLVNAVFAGSGPGTGLGVPFGPEDELVARRPEGPSPAAELLVVEATDGDDGDLRRLREARALAARAVELVAAGRRPGEIAVLFRRLTHVALFERAFREAGLPVRVARGGGFFQAPEVRDLGELLASVEEPGDAIAWAALLRSPLCGLSDGSLVALARRGLPELAAASPAAAGRLLADALGAEPPQGEAFRLGRFLATWRELRDARGRLDAHEALGIAVFRLDLQAALLAGPDGERRAANVVKALALARSHAAAGRTAAELAERLRRLARMRPREPEAEVEGGDAVSLLTVHQAKGLEWPVVLVPELAARPPAARRRPVLDEAGRVAVPFPAPGGEELEETATTARVRADAAAAESAESMRLLYVALTRAREQLVLSGAGGRSSGGSWAAAVSALPEALLARRPASAPGVAGLPPAPGAHVDVHAPRLRDAPPAAPVRVPVTDLAEYAFCPRRHWLGIQMRLAEPRAGAGAPGPASDDPGRATFRGTLAHAILAEVDLSVAAAARRRLLESAARRHGEDPRRPAIKAIVDDVEGFLDSTGGRVLVEAAERGALRREVPFVIRLGEDGPPGIAPADAGDVYLDGTIDALVVGPGEVRVLDYKFARHHPGAEERYRFQLEAYALAASRAFPGRPVRAVLHYIRPPAREIDVTPPPAALERLAATVPALARAASRGERRDAPPAVLGRDRGRCSAEGCGFVTRCFGPPGPPAA